MPKVSLYPLGSVGNLLPILAHSSRPRLIDMSKVYRQTNVENLEQAFGVAERDLGVTRLLDPEGKNGASTLIICLFTSIFLDSRKQSYSRQFHTTLMAFVLNWKCGQQG